MLLGTPGRPSFDILGINIPTACPLEREDRRRAASVPPVPRSRDAFLRSGARWSPPGPGRGGRGEAPRPTSGGPRSWGRARPMCSASEGLLQPSILNSLARGGLEGLRGVRPSVFKSQRHHVSSTLTAFVAAGEDPTGGRVHGHRGCPHKNKRATFMRPRDMEREGDPGRNDGDQVPTGCGSLNTFPHFKPQNYFLQHSDPPRYLLENSNHGG